MALPKPVPGLVIRYSYLWHSEHLEGRDEGQKDRPCAIFAAIQTDTAGDMRVLVLPTTHSQPDQSIRAIEIPLKVKQRLRLDDDRSWIVVSEWNEFIWPGPDPRRLPNSDDSTVAYAVLMSLQPLIIFRPMLARASGLQGPSRYANNRCFRQYIRYCNGIRSNPAVITHDNTSQQTGTCSNIDVPANVRNAWASPCAYRYLLKYEAIWPNDCLRVNHDTIWMRYH